MALTLPQWLHPFTTRKQLEVTQSRETDKDSIKPSINEPTPSLTYLDEYIHQWF